MQLAITAIAVTAGLVFSLAVALFTDRSFSLPIAGSGLILSTAAIILLSSGVLAEIVYNLGDVRDSDFARLTLRIRRGGSGGRRQVVE